MIDQLHRLGEMVAIGDDHFRIVLLHGNRYGLVMFQVKDLIPVHHRMNGQQTQEHLVLTGNDNMIGALYPSCFLLN